MKEILLATFCLCVTLVPGQLTEDRSKLLNWCIDSKHHKEVVGPESELFGQCKPWRERSCCTFNTTKLIHESSIYQFKYDHCPSAGVMSAECKKHFTQDHCFYECSPNVGPWAVKSRRSWRRERFYEVPLCETDCEAWFKACKADYTCTDNWVKNFDWVSTNCPEGTCKTNICPSASRCKTFEEIYGNAINFCQKVWDHSWLVAPSTDPCMRLWFNPEYGNPNDKVAELRIHSIINAAEISVIVGKLSLLVPLIMLIDIFKIA